MLENKIVKIYGKEYTLSFPTVGQLLLIEQVKTALTNGQYALLVYSGTKESKFVLDVIDAIATFSALIPDFEKEFGITKKVLDQDPVKVKELRRAFSEYWTWYNSIYTIKLEDVVAESHEPVQESK